MTNLVTIAAGLMDSGDDLIVRRDPETNTVIYVEWAHSGEQVEYLRGMVELIAESTGLPLQDGTGVSAIYEAILDRTSTRVTDI